MLLVGLHVEREVTFSRAIVHVREKILDNISIYKYYL